MRMPAKIKVTASMDRMGNITARPVSDRYAKAFAKHVKEMGGPGDIDAFFQDGGPATDFLTSFIPRRHVKDLENGWDVTWMADPWEVGHWYGYDAHTLAEAAGRPSASLRRRAYVGDGSGRKPKVVVRGKLIGPLYFQRGSDIHFSHAGKLSGRSLAIMSVGSDEVHLSTGLVLKWDAGKKSYVVTHPSSGTAVMVHPGSIKMRETESVFATYIPPVGDNMGADPEKPRSGQWTLRMLQAIKTRLAPKENSFVKNKRG